MKSAKHSFRDSSILPHLHNQLRQHVFIGWLQSTGIWRHVGTICYLPNWETKAGLSSFTFVNFRLTRCPHVGQDIAVGIATRYGLDGPGIVGGRGFPRPSRPALEPTQPPIWWVLYIPPESKAAGAWLWPITLSNIEVKEIVELYFYLLSGTSLPVL
jgi:hypothetical protein